MTKSLAIILLGLFVGCSTVPLRLGSNRHYHRDVVLSRQHPQDDFLKVRLVAIAEDGTTTIEVNSTGETLRAAPGKYFVSKAYGTQGLRLISASDEKHEARFLLTWAGTKLRLPTRVF